MPSRLSVRTVSATGQRGAALLLLLLLIVVGVLAVFVTGANRAAQQHERDRITSEALAQAKAALIGYAATYRDTHPGDVFGYLPLPDLGSSRNGTPEEGNAAGNFSGNSTNLTVIGRLPWRALGLPPLRDGQGECLWYAVSGSFQNVQQAEVLNWDSLGHFNTYSSNGTSSGTVSTSGTSYVQRPVAIVFSASAVLQGQNRQTSTSDNVGTCGGNYDARNYLDSFSPDANIQSIVNYFSGSTNNSTGYAYSLTSALDGSQLNATQLAAPKKIIFGDVAVNDTKIVNEKIITITADEVFQRVKKRNDFATQIQNLLNDTYFQTTGIAIIGPKGTDGINCSNLSPSNRAWCKNWKEMLLLTNFLPASPITIDGSPTPGSCDRVLIFGGQKTAGQLRSLASDKAEPANYIEDANLAAYAVPVATSGSFSGVSAFSSNTASADVVRCIKIAGAVQTSFASNLGNFSSTGTLVSDVGGIQTYSTGVTTNSNDNSLSIGGAAGSTGGCFWHHDAVPLAGKTLRAYYDYQFSNTDTRALTGTGSDRGNGFTFQMVRSDLNPPPLNSPPAVCGLEADMGALALGNVWASGSVIIETDVHWDVAKFDPVENHTAIMYGGNLQHSLTNGNPTVACNGTAAGCRHTPANKFEESPSPLPHNQRIEIHTGCDSSCSSCDPTNHVAPNTYAQISAWVDCANCDDVAVDLFGAELITAAKNRDFSAPGNWAGTNWSLVSGALTHTVAGVAAVSLPNSALVSSPAAGSAYEVTVTIATTTPGKLVIAFGGASSSSIDLVAGISSTYTVRLNAISAGVLTLTPDAVWIGAIDNVSVKRLPTIQRCIDLDAFHDARMNSVYFGFTGGFLSGTNTRQGVTFRNFFLRSE